MPPRSGQAHELTTVDGLAQLSFLIYQLLERRAAAHDLSIVQTRLLGVLRDRRPTMNELGRLLSLDKSSVSGLVDRAERRGLVERSPSPQDGRAVLVSLTDQGRAIVADVAPRFGEDVAELLAPLSASDGRALSRIVSRALVAHAEEQGIDLFPAVPVDRRR